MYSKSIKEILFSFKSVHFPPLFFCLIVLLVFASAPLFAQSENFNEENVYVINSWVYNVDGVTRHYALDYCAGFITGEEIKGYSNLEKYIQDKTQILMNERLFDSVNIDHTIGTVNIDGEYPVYLIIHVIDTWNFIVLPYPKYSSNSGFELTLKILDNNFLGTMSPLDIDIKYRSSEEGLNFFTLMVDSGIPVKLFNLYWNINFDNEFQYRPDMDSPFFYGNTTGLSAELPVGNAALTFGFSESFFINQENPGRYREASGRIQEGFYMQSRPYISLNIPTGFFFMTWAS